MRMEWDGCGRSWLGLPCFARRARLRDAGCRATAGQAADDGEGRGPGLGGCNGKAERPERYGGPAIRLRGGHVIDGHDGGRRSAAGLWRAEEPDCGRAGLGEDGAVGCGRRGGCGGRTESGAVAGDDAEDTGGAVWAEAASRAAGDAGICADGGQGRTEDDAEHERSGRTEWTSRTHRPAAWTRR